MHLKQEFLAFYANEFCNIIKIMACITANIHINKKYELYWDLDYKFLTIINNLYRIMIYIHVKLILYNILNSLFSSWKQWLVHHIQFLYDFSIIYLLLFYIVIYSFLLELSFGLYFFLPNM